MSLEILDSFDESLSFNVAFYGVPLLQGGYVWSNNVDDLLNYPGRVIGGAMIKSCWGEVRKRILEHADG